MIMAHSDDEGLVLPPRVAPDVAAIVPIYKSPEDEAKVRGFVEKIVAALTDGNPTNKIERHGLETYLFNAATEQRIVADFREGRPGEKHFHWEQRGVPFRIEVGPRDVDQSSFVLKGRIDGSKTITKLDEISGKWLRDKLDGAQIALFDKARQYRESNTRDASTYDELKQMVKEQGGFVRCYFKPDRANEAKIKEETKATVRVVPFDQPSAKGKDIITGEETDTQVLFAQAY
jgi:prolyl-tRNA synthetase